MTSNEILAYAHQLEDMTGTFDGDDDDVPKEPDNPDVFFQKSGECPHCWIAIPVVHHFTLHGSAAPGWPVDPYEATVNVDVWACHQC
jgi:hypothetical protein